MNAAICGSEWGERRYHRWAASGGLERERQDCPERRAELLERLCLDTTRDLDREIRALLAGPRLPLCLVDHKVRHTHTTVLGPDTLGLAADAWADDPHAEEVRRTLTVRSDDPPRRRWWQRGPALRIETARVLVHELAHAWLEPPARRREPRAIRTARHELRSTVARIGEAALGYLTRIEVQEGLQRERRANRLAEHCGFLQPHESYWCSWYEREAGAP